MIKAFVFAALFAAVADAACSNACSGHGTCGEEDLCKCFPRWTSPDCSTRECPYGPSWVAQPRNSGEKQIGPATGALGGRHGYTVCSSKGECNQDSGECECFTGYTGLACSRQSCPDDCSGHGRCITNLQADNQYTYDNTFVSEFWDADMTRLCTCDRGWQGYACSKRICPVGADPLTCEKQKNEPTVQRITLDNMDFPFASSATFKIAITLRFKDMFNGVYTTQPIRLAGKSRGLKDTVSIAHTSPTHQYELQLRPCASTGPHSTCSQSGAWTALNQYDDTDGAPFVAGGGKILEDYDANRIRYALESLPNFAIPSINVTDVYPLGDTATDVDDIRYNTRWFFDVTFSHPANAGAQNLMGCTIASPATDNAAVSPRMGAPTIWERTTAVDECFDACADVLVRASDSGSCADVGGTPNTAHTTQSVCDGATDCGAGSNLACVWSFNLNPTTGAAGARPGARPGAQDVRPMYQVDRASDGTSLCAAKTSEAMCDGYCTWTVDKTVAYSASTGVGGGHCAPEARACLRDDGNGKYICDGAVPGITDLNGGAAKMNLKNAVCNDVVAACAGAPACVAHSTEANCLAEGSATCTWSIQDCDNGCFERSGFCAGAGLADTATADWADHSSCFAHGTQALCGADSGNSCTWHGKSCEAVPACPGTDPTPTAGASGCPTASSDLVQGVALAITDEGVWDLNKGAFEASLKDTCTGGRSQHALCTTALSAEDCDGMCVWDATNNVCGGVYSLTGANGLAGVCADAAGVVGDGGMQTTQSTCEIATNCGTSSDQACIWVANDSCHNAATQALCTAGSSTCAWAAAKAVVQHSINVDQWWKSPVSVNPLSTVTNTLVSNAACAGTVKTDCNGDCSWTRGDESGLASQGFCADSTGAVGAGGAHLTQSDCNSATDCGSGNDAACIWGTPCASVTEAAKCDKGCHWDTTCKPNVWRCTSNHVNTRSSPTCTVAHVKTASPADKHVCSNRGVCDESTGLCGCFEGYAGEDCALQNIYF